MKEKDFIQTIKNIIGNEFIGDDCAYLKDLGIVVSQDSLVEDVHFKRDFISPYSLGYKSAAVNISDIYASAAVPLYLTIALSLPKNADNEFVKEFYKGAKSVCTDDIKIVGGDITTADKIYISVCAIGSTKGRNISSRKNAKTGYKIVAAGLNGSSGAGLQLLLNNKKSPEKFIKAHLEPVLQKEFSQAIGTSVKEYYAMMDTSDGIADALSQIAYSSGKALEIDFDKIPTDEDIKQFPNWQKTVLYGGEDYGLVAAIPMQYDIGTQIGTVKDGSGIDLKINNKIVHLTDKDIEQNIYDHFKQ